MKTTLGKKEKFEPKWFLIDAKDQVVGRIATVIADLLRGKNKALFTPNMDCGDFVIVINSSQVKFTGNKRAGKIYYHHSGFPGGIKSISAESLMKKDPTKALEIAVRGMLPRNRLRNNFMKKLKIYANEKHPHSAQEPIVLAVK